MIRISIYVDVCMYVRAPKPHFYTSISGECYIVSMVESLMRITTMEIMMSTRIEKSTILFSFYFILKMHAWAYQLKNLSRGCFIHTSFNGIVYMIFTMQDRSFHELWKILRTFQTEILINRNWKETGICCALNCLQNEFRKLQWWKIAQFYTNWGEVSMKYHHFCSYFKPIECPLDIYSMRKFEFQMWSWTHDSKLMQYHLEEKTQINSHLFAINIFLSRETQF